MINVQIDELTPCLTDNDTGEIVETEVIRIRRKTFLSKYNKKSGWYASWSKLADKNEIYALVISGTVDIQGMVALHRDDNQKAVFIDWMVAAPHNNKLLTEIPKYTGVGGHLFAIASDKSLEYGFGGAITGNAANIDLVHHYCEVFGAVHLSMLHPYQIFIDEQASERIRDTYDYDWTDEEN